MITVPSGRVTLAIANELPPADPVVTEDPALDDPALDEAVPVLVLVPVPVPVPALDETDPSPE